MIMIGNLIMIGFGSDLNFQCSYWIGGFLDGGLESNKIEPIPFN